MTGESLRFVDARFHDPFKTDSHSGVFWGRCGCADKRSWLPRLGEAFSELKLSQQLI